VRTISATDEAVNPRFLKQVLRKAKEGPDASKTAFSNGEWNFWGFPELMKTTIAVY
jgi:hypothetical protein